MSVDIVRPLRRDPFPVTLAGRASLVPYRDARWWLETLAVYVPRRVIIPALTEDARERVTDGLLEGTVTGRDLEAVSLGLLGHVTGTGKRWWTGYNLALISGSDSAVGAMTVRGVDPERCTLAQWCSAVQTLYLDGASEEARMKFMAATEPPPDGYDVGAAWDDGMSLVEAQRVARSLPGSN